MGGGGRNEGRGSGHWKGWMNIGMQAQQERDQMTRSRKVVGCGGIKGEEGAGRGTAVLIYRSRVMWPCYVTMRQPGQNTLTEDPGKSPYSAFSVFVYLHTPTCWQALTQQMRFLTISTTCVYCCSYSHPWVSNLRVKISNYVHMLLQFFSFFTFRAEISHNSFSANKFIFW